MNASYTYAPIHAKNSVRCCFPKKNVGPPQVTVEKGEDQDDSFDPTVYLLNVQVDPSGEKVAVSTSNNEIKLYSMSNASLVGQLNGHTDSVTDIKFSQEDPHLLVSCGVDGLVSVWDVRSSSQASAFKVGGEKFQSAAISGSTVAGGTSSGAIGFWDLRSGAHEVLRDYFSEDVSQLGFHPTMRNVLFAGSYDGLINQIDCSVALGDDAILDVLNVGTSVSKMGFFGTQHQLLYTLAPTEQLQIWNLANSAKITDFGFDLLHNLSGLTNGNTINYIIDCKYDTANDTLLLFAGSFTGQIFVFSCTDSAFTFLAELKGHSAIVRDLWFDSASGTSAVSVGEDSMLFLWSNTPSSSASPKHSFTPTYTSSKRSNPY